MRFGAHPYAFSSRRSDYSMNGRTPHEFNVERFNAIRTTLKWINGRSIQKASEKARENISLRLCDRISAGEALTDRTLLRLANTINHAARQLLTEEMSDARRAVIQELV